MEARDRVIHLLKNYKSNTQRIKRLETDDTIREWHLDYTSRAHGGGMSSPNLYRPKANHTDKSIQEKLLDEKQNVLVMLQRLQQDIEITQLLLLQLSDEDVQLIQMRYFDRYQVHQICNHLYISKSSFYRRQGDIIDRLVQYYQNIDIK